MRDDILCSVNYTYIQKLQFRLNTKEVQLQYTTFLEPIQLNFSQHVPNQNHCSKIFFQNTTNKNESHY
jgi:hypothetical protein